MIKGDTGYQKKNLLNAARLLGGGDLTPLAIPEMAGDDGTPGYVLLKPPSAGRILSILALSDNETEREELLFKMLAECVVDESGKPLFEDGASENLRAIPATVFGRLTSALMDLANTASIVAGTSGNGQGGTPGLPIVAPEVPPTTSATVPALTVGSASPTASASASESGT